MEPRPLKVLLLTVAAAMAASAAQAFQFDAGPVRGSLDSTLTFGAAMRLLNQDNRLVGDDSVGAGSNVNVGQWSNGDNGNLNYNAGDFYSGYLKGTHELLVSFPWSIKFMGRGTWLYDFQADDTRRTELKDSARDQVARDVQLLDLWVSKQFNIGPQSARVRLGNQVVSWGESLFTPGGINSTNSLDIQKLLVPGTQLKEAVIPAPIVSLATGLGFGLNVEAYYQFAWNRSRLPPVGTYWSAADFIGKGKDLIYFDVTNFNLGGVDAAYVANQEGISVKEAQNGLNVISGNGDPRGLIGKYGSIGVPFLSDKKARDDGQYGIALHYKPRGINMDLGVYYMNYHDKTPNVEVVGGQPRLKYLEDRKLFGVSANFPVGDLAVGWELSYRPKDAVALTTTCFNPGGHLDANTNTAVYPAGHPREGQAVDCEAWIDREKYQMALTGILSLTPGDYGWALNLLGADTATLLAEVVGIRYVGVTPQTKYVRKVDGVEVMQAPSANLNFWKHNDPDFDYAITGSEGTEYSAGYTIDFSWVYDGSLIPGWQVQPGITFYHAAIGDTPTSGPTYLEGNKSTNIYILFNRNPATWQAGINYAAFFGDNMRQVYRDRDFIGGFVSYNF